MTLLVTVGRPWSPESWLERFTRLGNGRKVIDARQPYDPAEVEFAAVWKPEPGLLAGLPNLRAIFNLGAGVDALMADKTLPDVPLHRIINPDMTARMTEWVTLQVLFHLRQMPAYLAQQRESRWQHLDQPGAKDLRVGMLGMGVLGRDAAEVLLRLGFQVAGWSRSGHDMPGVERFAGEAEFAPFLARTDILVALLPLTPDTRGILGAKLFAGLARDGALGGPVVINAGRGGLQVEADLIAALSDGTLKGATIDVFEPEPLPPDNPLWKTPNLVITPHVAADSTPDGLVSGVIADIQAFERGEKLASLVDKGSGY
jgi:glyoxylate/hydroxypyruvate reductase A